MAYNVTTSDLGENGKVRRTELYVKLFQGLIVSTVGVLLLLDASHNTPVAASFTRVAGQTRVETALEVSRFWANSASHVVTTSSAPPSDNDINRQMEAATCAANTGAPLLYTPLNPYRKRIVEERASLLGGERPKGKEGTRCSLTNYNGKWWLFEPSLGDRRRYLGLPTKSRLAPTVVFAAPVLGDDEPDVAVAVALARHLTDKNGYGHVCVVVTPPYVEANPSLEAALRKSDVVVQRGLVLGEVNRIPNEASAYVRQVLVSPSRTGLLSELRTSLGSAGELLIAIMGLIFGTGTLAAAAAPKLAEKGMIWVMPWPFRNSQASNAQPAASPQPEDGGKSGSSAWFKQQFAPHEKVSVSVAGLGNVVGTVRATVRLPDNDQGVIFILLDGTLDGIAAKGPVPYLVRLDEIKVFMAVAEKALT